MNRGGGRMAELQEPQAKALRKVTLRLIPFLFVLYIVAWLDRVNVSFAALQMNDALDFSAINLAAYVSAG